MAGSCGIGAAGTAAAPRDSEQSLAREAPLPAKILSRSFLSSGRWEEVSRTLLFVLPAHFIIFKADISPPSHQHTPPAGGIHPEILLTEGGAGSVSFAVHLRQRSIAGMGTAP